MLQKYLTKKLWFKWPEVAEKEDIDMDEAQYITMDEAEAASEAHNRLASGIRLGDEILD